MPFILDSFSLKCLGEPILVEFWPELTERRVSYIYHGSHSSSSKRLYESIEILLRVVSGEKIELLTDSIQIPFPPVSYLYRHWILGELICPVLHRRFFFFDRCWHGLETLL